MVAQFLFSPQLKGNVIITNKMVYTSCDVKLRMSVNWQYQEHFKTLWGIYLVLSPPKMKILSVLVQVS